MKKLFLFSLFIFLCNPISAQKIEKGKYYEDKNLNTFIGTWQGTNGNDTLIVALEKYKVHAKRIDIYMDMMGGWYKYIENGIVKYDFLDQIGAYDNSLTPGFMRNDSTLQLSMTNPKWWKPRLVSFKQIANEQNKGRLKIYFSNEISAWIALDKSQKEIAPISTPSTWKMKRIK